MRQPDIFQTPLNETLSHSNGKVVFDHGPNFVAILNHYEHENLYFVNAINKAIKQQHCTLSIIYKFENCINGHQYLVQHCSVFIQDIVWVSYPGHFLLLLLVHLVS